MRPPESSGNGWPQSHWPRRHRRPSPGIRQEGSRSRCRHGLDRPDRLGRDGWPERDQAPPVGRAGTGTAAGRPVRGHHAMDRPTAGHLVPPIEPVVADRLAAIASVSFTQAKRFCRASKSRHCRVAVNFATVMPMRLRNNSEIVQVPSIITVSIMQIGDLKDFQFVMPEFIWLPIAADPAILQFWHNNCLRRSRGLRADGVQITPTVTV